MPADRLDHLIRREHRAPLGFDRVDVGANPSANLGQQMTEAAEDRHQDLVARNDERGQARLDAGPRCPVDKERPIVLGAEDLAVERHDLIHVFGELRVELTQHGRRHGPQHARIHVDRPRPHEQPGLRVEITEQVVIIRHGYPYFSGAG